MATATKSKSKKATEIRPLDDRVLVKPTQAEEKTASGIFLPDGAREKPVHGKVIAAGPGKLNDDDQRTPLSVKKGDTVVYGKYAGTEVDIDGEKYVILHENELLAKID